MSKEISSKKLRVWWIPQIGIKNIFYIPIKTVEEGAKIISILSAYDLFQLNNSIKPDYSNVGGIEEFNEEEQEWVNWEIDTDDYYYDNVRDYCQSEDCLLKEELEKFEDELFKQLKY